ncbi:TPA: GTP-binding protein [Candidatus Woesearchaeota archaeon]|nr:GTP-binding protein [Candidatus Woesearchaeota archaeon]
MLDRHLMGILRSFPSLDSLTEFYNELVRTTLEYPDLKKALGSVKWAMDKIDEFSGKYEGKLRKCQHLRKISDYSSEYYGRVGSIMKQVKKHLKYLDHARQVMRDYPSIKSGMPTVCIAGFPNVGKTTLLLKLTGSAPEISNYAFTTKKLNVGYATMNREKVQFIDTPGTLDRVDKMNPIEKQAYLSIKYCADLVVFVADPTETYPLQDQKRLLARVLKGGKPVFLYISKTDISSEEQIRIVENTLKSSGLVFIKTIENLKNEIIHLLIQG